MTALTPPSIPAPQTHLTPSAFIAKHAQLIASRITGPIADVACGSGRNLLPFLHSGQRIDCYDICPDCIDPYIVQACGQHLRWYETNLLNANFSLPPAEYSLVFLVHFYNARVVSQIVQTIKPGGLLVLETIDDRRSNYIELPQAGEIFQLITPLRILSCVAKPAGPRSDRQVIKLLAQRP